MIHARMKMIPVQDDFPHFDKQYMCEKCCCGTVHCQTGARRVGIFMAAMLALSVLNAVAKGGIDFLTIAVLALEVLCTVMLFIGISKMNPRMVIPFVVFMFLAFLSSLFLCVALLIGATFASSSLRTYLEQHARLSDYHHNGMDLDEYVRMVCIFGAVVVLFCVLMNYWFFDIVKRCYTYLKDFEEYRQTYGSVAVDIKPMRKELP